MNQSTLMKHNPEFFAALQDPDELANAILEKVRVWRQYCVGTGLMGSWQRKISNYYGISSSGNSSQVVTAGGSEGELSMVKVNDLHNLIQSQLVLVTSQRPAGVARAINSDTSSLKSSRIAEALAEFYMSEIGFEKKFVSSTEIALLCDEGFIDLFWDKDAGDEIAGDDQGTVMSGDCVLRTHCSWNVARDPGANVDDQHWHIISFKGNRYDFMAKYPDFADKILMVGDDNLPVVPMNKIPEGSDEIFCHLLVADRCAAVPKGRYAFVIGDFLVGDMQEGLPYKPYPVERIAPGDVIDGPTGYSASNDIMVMEELTDGLYSIAASNNITFGGQNIVGPSGGNLKVSDIAKGLRFFELPADQVDSLRPLELLKTSPELYNFIQLLGNKKEQMVGSNSVVRGQPQGELSGASGSALALIQAQAISFNSGIQRSYFSLLSNTMTKLIQILQSYADTPRVAKIVGRLKSSGLKEFKYTGQDLSSVSSVVYELVNPISQTFGGRLTFAQDLLKAGQIKSPKQYINLATTGQLDVLTQDDEADGMLILEENEWLSEGKPFKAVITQIHADHIKSHTSQITLEAQANDPDFVQRCLDHIQDHLNVWQQASMTNPGILIATGQQPLPPPPPPPGMLPPGIGQPPGVHPPGPPPTSGPQGIPPGAPKPPPQGGGEPPAVLKAGEVKEPNAPRLPFVAGTGQRAQVPGVTDQGV